MYKTIEGYPDYVETQGYGFFGYPGAMVDRAIRTDDPVGLQKMIDIGWIDANTKTMDNLTMREYCIERGASKCAELFEAL